MLYKKLGIFLLSLFLLTGVSFAGLTAVQVDFLASGVLNSTGQPNSFGTVTFKDSISSATKNVYSSSDKTTVLSQPVVLNLKGAATVFADGNYNITIRNKAGTIISTMDGFNYEKSSDTESTEVDLLNTYGNSTSQIKNMIDTLGSTDKITVAIKAGTYTISEDLVFPSNYTLHFYDGALWTTGTGLTTSINGTVVAGAYRIFYGNGTVLIADALNPIQYPSWKGNSIGRADIENLYVDTMLSSSPNGVTFEQDGTFEKNMVINGDLTVLGTINAIIAGTSSESIYSLDSDKLDAQHGAYYLDADNFNAGTILDARMAGDYTFGNLALTGTATANKLTDGTISITAGKLTGATSITATNVNISGTVTANKLTDGTISITGGNLTGATSITATNITGTLQTAAQTNITSLGTLSALGVTGVTNLKSASAGSYSILVKNSLNNYILALAEDASSDGVLDIRNSAGTVKATIDGSDGSATFLGGLNVGTATGAGAGEIRSNGTITQLTDGVGVVGIWDATGAYDTAVLYTSAGGSGKAGLSLGSGSSAKDTNLYRDSTDVLKTDDSLTVALGLNIGTATSAGTGVVNASGAVQCSGQTSVYGTWGDTQPQMLMGTNAGGVGKHGLQFGAGGALAIDTSLYRDSANVLKTDDSLTVALGLNVSGNARIDGTLTLATTLNAVAIKASHCNANSSAGMLINNLNNQPVASFGVGSSTSSVFMGGATFQGLLNSITMNATGALNVSGNATFTNGIDAGGNGNMIKCKVLEIGTWNMDADETKSVAHGLTSTKIRSVNTIITMDNGTIFTDIMESFDSIGGPAVSLVLDGGWHSDTTNIYLRAKRGSTFDNADYNDGTANRGYITIWYEQ